MASLTHTIGGVSFGALSSASGQYSLGCYPTSMLYDIKRFHCPGSDGNFIVRGGRMGGKLVARMRYVGAAATILGTFRSHAAAWENAAVTVVDSAGTSYTRCSLEGLAMRVTSDPKGFNGVSYIDVEATFIRDS